MAAVLQGIRLEVLNMTNIALLILRLVVGGLLAGHGAQKLFGFSGGPGPEGTTRLMGKLGLKPSERWAYLAGGSELGGGALTALGLLNPLGPIAIIGAMTTAALTAHRDKPIWVTAGGAELPATNTAIATALLLAGPGALSLDALFGTKVPWWVSFLALAGTATGVLMATEATEANAAKATATAADRSTDAEPRPQPVSGNGHARRAVTAGA
jgi:putative oxidoreductase